MIGYTWGQLLTCPLGSFWAVCSGQWAVQLPCPALPTDFDGQVSCGQFLSTFLGNFTGDF